LSEDIIEWVENCLRSYEMVDKEFSGPSHFQMLQRILLLAH